jgi:hypothetical protein
VGGETKTPGVGEADGTLAGEAGGAGSLDAGALGAGAEGAGAEGAGSEGAGSLDAGVLGVVGLGAAAADPPLKAMQSPANWSALVPNLHRPGGSCSTELPGFGNTTQKPVCVVLQSGLMFALNIFGRLL